MGKLTDERNSTRDWNEFITFSRLVFPYLNKELGYPTRDSEYFEEQKWVRKKGNAKGPYDGAFRDEQGIILLIEVKREGKELTKQDEDQAFDYCFSETFELPPPYVLVTNGHEHRWFRRRRVGKEKFKYTKCPSVPWRKAIEESGAGDLIEQLSMPRVIKLLGRIRSAIFHDLAERYFPESFSLDESNLGRRRVGFERILATRKSFVDPSLDDVDEEKAVRCILSSVALSLTLKILFLKIWTERRFDPFPTNIRQLIDRLAGRFPGILVAEPYDILELSDEVQESIFDLIARVGILEAVLFKPEGNADNPIGQIYDGLVSSEEMDVQVSSLGNVYTPEKIVASMIEASGRSVDWKDAKVLEPACGSGHFVRSVYRKMVAAKLADRNGRKTNPSDIHKSVLASIQATDIDAFAVQTTQLGMFLELFRSESVWRTLAPNDKFDFGKTIRRGDFLDAQQTRALKRFQPDLVIGNPPYGVEVTQVTAAQFSLNNRDSYGCFLVQALETVRAGGAVMFIVSNTFLSARSHRQLRERILTLAEVKSIFNLHRHVFPGRDVFSCVIEARRRPNSGLALSRTETYQFLDGWSLHPNSEDFDTALRYFGKLGRRPSISENLFKDYEIPEDLIGMRLMPPHPNRVDEWLEENEARVVPSDAAFEKREQVLPLVGGATDLFLLCADRPFRDLVQVVPANFFDCSTSAFEIRRKERKIKALKLWQVAEVRVGLQTSDDVRFVKKSPGVVANARQKNILDVAPKCTLSTAAVARLTETEKTRGIPVMDYSRDKYFVPFDKNGEQDTAMGELRSFWSPVEFWIDWSERSVKELRKRANYTNGTPRKAYIRNEHYYFTKGIRFTTTGLYAPTFELSHGGVFSHMSSLILPNDASWTNFLLGVLTSPLVRYIVKSFLQTTVHAEADIIRQIPIPCVTSAQAEEISQLVEDIVARKQGGRDTERQCKVLWRLVHRLYGLDRADETELASWFKRRYPLFGRDVQATPKRGRTA